MAPTPTPPPPTDRRPDADAESRRPAARAALLGALTLGAVADLLFRDVPLGLNVAAWTACAVALLVTLARRVGRPVTVGAGLLAGLALAFALCVAWRDARTLVALDLAALATCAAALSCALRHGTAWAVERADAGAYAAGAAAVARDLLAGAGPLARGDAALGELRGAHRTQAAVIAARGLVLAAPALGVFALLLASADGAFARLLARAFDVDLAATAGHLAWTAVVGWGAAGFAAGALLAPEPATAAESMPGTGRRRWFGRATGAELCVAVGLIDALFLAFVVVQLGWLFGGRAVVGGGEGVTYAGYARRGFFELATVAGLALPLLLATRAGVVRAVARGAAGPRAVRAYQVVAGGLIALVIVMLASAADRMRLYQAAYGVTELRLYVSAFMAWLLAVFAWAAATLLRERPAPFALGAVLSGWAWVFGLNAADPAALVVGANASRHTATRAVDAAYLAGLSADAVPGLVARVWPLVWPPSGDARYGACAVARSITAARTADNGGWRAWNLARRRAAAVSRTATSVPPGTTDICTPHHTVVQITKQRQE